MISSKLLEEFKQIMKDEYGVEYTDAEAHEAATNLVGYFDILLKMDYEQKQKAKNEGKDTLSMPTNSGRMETDMKKKSTNGNGHITSNHPTSKTSSKGKKANFTFIDLFAGIGGTRLGYEAASGKCVFTSEWDIPCQKTYEANFGDKPHGDITKIKAKDIPDFDVLLAGFPCQPFSSIGLRQGFKHATQGTLFYDVARIIDEKKPKAFMLENVPGLVTHDQGNTFKIILETLDKLDYEVFYKILDSANFGVPQQRKRIYIVGFRRDEFDEKVLASFKIPESNGKTAYICDYLEKNVEGYSISEHLQSTYMFKKDDGRPMIVDKKSKIQTKTLVASYHKIQRLTGTFVKDGPTGLRLFTVNECKALMGFPPEFIVPVSRTQMYRQFGNSIVVPVVEAVAKEVAKVLKKAKSKSIVSDIDESRSKQSFIGAVQNG